MSEAELVVPGEREISAATRSRIEQSFPENTRRAYSRIWAGFTDWCAGPGRAALPATPETLAEYVSHRCDDGKSPATIEQEIAAIRTAHRMAGHDKQPDTEKALRVLKTHRRERAAAGLSGQRQALPIVVESLRKIVDTISKGTLIGQRDHALLLLGIVSFGRRSEMAAFTWDDVTKAPEGLMLRIRMSKTDQEARGASVPVLYGSFPGTDPVRVLNRWRETLARRGQDHGPILRSVDRHGVIGPSLSPKAINEIVQRRAEAAGLGPGYTAHSLRAGAATIAYMNGAPISTICRLGRWKPGSPVVLSYIRSVDQWKDHPFRGVL